MVSVLGPLLFFRYINDITKHLLSLSRLFVNDTSLYSPVTIYRNYTNGQVNG